MENLICIIWTITTFHRHSRVHIPTPEPLTLLESNGSP